MHIECRIKSKKKEISKYIMDKYHLAVVLPELSSTLDMTSDS